MSLSVQSQDLFTGDTWVIKTTLYIDAVAPDLTGATITAVVTSTDGDDAKAVTEVITCSAVEPDADFASGVVVAVFPSTSAVPLGTRFVEIQVDLGGRKTTWPRLPIHVKKGIIP